MFDRTTVNVPRGTQETLVEIREHRAPTDDSVRLLQEMESKIEERIIARYGLQNTMVDAEWIVTKLPKDFRVKVLCRAKLGGQEFRSERMLDNMTMKLERATSVPTVLFELLTETLAKGLYYYNGAMGFRCLYAAVDPAPRFGTPEGRTNG